MFVILLRLSEKKALASEYMEVHKEWIDKYFKEGIFLVVGSLEPKQGGGILAQGVSREEIESIVKKDPFVVHGIVQYEVIEISPSKTDKRFEFFKG